jgi:hypothetical protein
MKRKTKKVKVNKLFPGKPNYTGPNKGWFAFVHHGCLAEYSCNIAKRVRHVKHSKPPLERPIRLAHIMHIRRPLSTKLTNLHGNDHGNSVLRQDASGGREVMEYVKKHKPKHAWNGHSLTFPDGQHLRG